MRRKTSIIAAAAFCLASLPAFAQQDPAGHDAHHPSTEAAQTTPTTDATQKPTETPEMKAPSAASMPMMDCMKMMQSMMGGGAGEGKPGGMSGGMPMMGMMGAGPGGQQKGMSGSPSSMAFRMATEKMHAGMAVPSTGNADVDFVRGMMAHHRGAIEMAEAVLLYGKDPEVKKLAEGIINAQEAEVRQMRKWLLDHKDAAK